MPSDPSSPAFVVGITGHMDIPEEDVPEIEDRCRRLFRWLREAPEEADSAGSDHPDWWPMLHRRRLDHSGEFADRPLPGLGLEKQRIVLLTSLAPGADTIAARIALEEGVEVRAPLPFPAEVYPRATTFTAAPDPEKAVGEFQKLTDGENPSIETFPVLLASDIDRSPAERARAFAEDADAEDGKARNLRYRAAGEYVGTFCNVLFAFFQPAPVTGDAVDESSDVGSQTIVDIMRTGPTAGILPSASHFPWNDAVPVVHVPCRSAKRQASPSDDLSARNWRTTRATFLPPLWLEACHMDDDGEVDPECGRAGYAALRESARLLREYCDLVDSGPVASGETQTTLIDRESLIAGGLSERGREFLDMLSPIATARGRSANLANEADRERGKMMKWMAVFAFLAALSFHCFSHWHFHGASGHGPAHATPTPLAAEVAPLAVNAEKKDHAPGVHESLLQSAVTKSFLILTLVAVACAFFFFLRYGRTKCEWLRFDARAFSEGLRVQFYWAAAGLQGSVAERYMHRQKGELDWIRNAISSLSFPYERWARRFDELTQRDQQLIVGEVVSKWVTGQREFFRKAAAKAEHKLHRFHCFGWGMTLAGIFQIVLILAWKMAHPQSDSSFLTYCGLASVVFAIAAAMVERKRHRSGADSEHHPSGWIDRWFAHGRFAFGFLVSALACSILVILPPAHLTPGVKDLWVILIGAMLVSGAIAIAWSEKLLLSEQSRQYLSMHSLFRNAEDHLRKQLDEWNSPEENADRFENVDPKRKIQGTLFDIGKEALDENAEWLVLHRSRPFEPFLAG